MYKRQILYRASEWNALPPVREIYDCHLDDTREGIYTDKVSGRPGRFLSLSEVLGFLEPLEVERVIFMGAEPSLDFELPRLARALKGRGAYNILLTNGFFVPDLEYIDEVVFSIKAFDEGIHRELTGFSNKPALSNFGEFLRGVPKLRAESILIPPLVYFDEIERIARFIAGFDENIPYRIDAYIPVGGIGRRPYGWEIEEASGRARRYLKNVSYLKGGEEVKFRVRRIY